MRFKWMALFAFILAILAFSFCCCAKKSPPGTNLSEHSGNYSTIAEIKYKELDAVATMSQESPSQCTVVFQSPQSLKGMGFVFRRDDVDINYKGLSFTFDKNTMPQGIAANLAVSAINKAMKDDGLTVDVSGDTLEVKGMLESGDFILKLDKSTGNFMKLSIPNEEFEIQFRNFEFLD